MNISPEPDRSKNAVERAYAAIKRDIQTGRLAPHQHVLERDLSSLLKMSRTPIREACVRLQAEGLVEIVPRRGIRIVPISTTDLTEVYEVLATLEARAAQLAAARMLPEEELAPLSVSVANMHDALANGDLDRWAAADSEFHRLLVLASGNRHLATTAMQFSDLVHRARLATLRLRPIPKKSAQDHEDLVSAIRNGEADRAYQMHLSHRRDASDALVRLLDLHGLSAL